MCIADENTGAPKSVETEPKITKNPTVLSNSVSQMLIENSSLACARTRYHMDTQMPPRAVLFVLHFHIAAPSEISRPTTIYVRVVFNQPIV